MEESDVTTIDLTPLQQHQDWFLENLVNFVNGSQLEIGISLSVGGGIVSGTLIGGAQYFKAFAKEFAGAWPDEGRESIEASLARGSELYAQDTLDPEDNTNVRPASYIHLKDARLFSAAGATPSRGVLWRGRLCEVSGFFLGKMESD